MEDEETAARRRQRRLEKEASARLQTTVQPFSFEEREAAKQREKEEEARARAAMTPPSRFRARPIPAAVIDPYGWDRLQQEEDYRRLHAQFRAEEALLEARAPNDLDVRGESLGDLDMCPAPQAANLLNHPLRLSPRMFQDRI